MRYSVARSAPTGKPLAWPPTLAHVWANRLIFYKALRARFPDLPPLERKASVTKPADALAAFSALFKHAVERSGYCEPHLMCDVQNWATERIFHPATPSTPGAGRRTASNLWISAKCCPTW